MKAPEYFAQLDAIAQQTGHTHLAVTPTESGRRWVATCGCGFRSTTRRTQVDAAGALVHHVRLEVTKHLRNGTDHSPERVEVTRVS